MDAGIMVETLPILGICNLCLDEGIVKSMIILQDDNTETFTEMLLKCFSINVYSLDVEDTKRLICEPCIIKLQDAFHFKEKVETSLKILQTTLILGKETAEKKVKEESEYDDTNDHDYDPNCDDSDVDDELIFKKVKQEMSSIAEDNMVLNGLSIKKEPEEYTPRRTRRRGAAYFTVKKGRDISDSVAMVEAGLFPFKIGKNRTFSCAVCPEKSTSLDDLKTHATEHSISNIHAAFNKMLSSSLQRFYKSTNKLRCKVCKTDISDYQQLKQHIESCVAHPSRWNKLPFKLEKDQLDCPVCKKTFLNFVSLNTHMNEHYPNHICDSCGKAFASKARLRGHMRTHEVGDFPCRYCDAVFDRVTKRENHVSKEHKSGVRYACKRCNISLTSFYARQKHLAEVHNEELKRYKCKACSQSYITPGHLSSHVRRDHLNERNHKCDKCDLAFYTRNSLKMHMIKHDGERIHVCNICNKSYQRKKTLREHMRIHNNDKRFVCPVCGRAFTQKCTLKGHLKVHERKPEDERSLPATPPRASITLHF